MTRLGLLAYATDTGLGIQTRAMYKHLKPAKTMLVDLSQFNQMPVHDDWYTAAVRTHGIPTTQDIDDFLEGLDVVFVCETPLNYYLFRRARELGVRTVQQYNYEFLDYLTPSEMNRPALPRPDVLAAPTSWNTDKVARLAGVQIESLPVPIDQDELPRRTITQARTFIHIAGRPAVLDRNGTLDFIGAVRAGSRHMPDAEFIVYCQQPTPAIQAAVRGTRVHLIEAVANPAELYSQGDILVMPRRYGGLCLPAQEAVGSGIPVLMPNISPNNSWLPAEWLLRVKPGIQRFQPRTLIDVYSVHPWHLADRMRALYNDDSAVTAMHEQAKQLATQMSWDALLARYREVLEIKELVT